MKKPFSKRTVIPMEEMEAYLRRWEARAPGWVRVYALTNYGDWPVWCAEFTDPNVPQEEKYTAIVHAQHSGGEIAGANMVLSVGNYLATLDDRAKKILQAQTVLLIPCPVPDVYAKFRDGESHFGAEKVREMYRNRFGNDDCWVAFTPENDPIANGIDPETRPWTAAYWKLIDERMPEMVFDCHSVWFQEAIMAEYHGQLSASAVNRAHHRGFLDELQKAAEDAGYAMTNEDSLQRIPSMNKGYATLPQYRCRFWEANDGMIAHNYAYLKYHALNLFLEGGWEECALVRVIRALEIGAERGYPVDVIDFFDYGNFLCTGGKTPGERRRSRAELWQQDDCFGRGLVYPVTGGVSGILLTNGRNAYERVFANGGACRMDDFLDLLEQQTGESMQNVREALADELEMWMQSVGGPASKDPEKKAEIHHGATVRLGIQFADAEPTGVYRNGEKLCPGEYSVTRERNWTFLDVPLPVGELPEYSFVLATYDYTPKAVGIVEFE